MQKVIQTLNLVCWQNTYNTNQVEIKLKKQWKLSKCIKILFIIIPMAEISINGYVGQVVFGSGTTVSLSFQHWSCEF